MSRPRPTRNWPCRRRSTIAACGPGVGNVQFTTTGDGLTITEEFPSWDERTQSVAWSADVVTPLANGPAEGGAEACLEYAARTGLPSCTPHSITDPTALWRSVKNALQQGYALDDQEAELGVGCIGVPIRDSTNHIVAGISVSAPIERRREVWVSLIRQAGEKLSTRLGFHPENRTIGA